MNTSLNQPITLPSLLRFTLPSMAMMVVMSLYTVVDGTFVSRLIGTDAFSAVNIVYPLLSLTVGLGTMFGTGLAAIVSRMQGQGEVDRANRTLSFVLLSGTVLGVICTLVSWIFLDPILIAMGADASILDYCRDYALPLLPFFAPNILQLAFQALYVADGRPGMGLGVTVLGGLTNVALDYLFIAKLDMGISGAAVATGIGYTIPTLFGLWYFARGRGALRFVRPVAAWRDLVNTASNGSSEMVSNLSTSVTTFLFNIIMMRLLGSDGVAAISVLLYLDFVLIALSLGYSLGVAPLISYCRGSGDVARLQKLVRLSFALTVGTGLVMTLATLLFADGLSAIFTPRDSTVYLLAVSGLRIYGISYLFKGINVFSSALFTALEDGRTSALLSCMRTLVLLTGSLIALAALFGVDGVWFAAPVAEGLALVLSLLCLWRYRRTYDYF